MNQRLRQSATARNSAAEAGELKGARIAAVRASAALHPNAKHVLQVLLEHEGQDGMPRGKVARTQPEIARDCGLSVMTVSRMVERLTALGLVELERVHGFKDLPSGERTMHGCIVYVLNFKALDRLSQRPLRSILLGPDPTSFRIFDFLTEKQRRTHQPQGRGDERPPAAHERGRGEVRIAGAGGCIPL